MNSPYTFGDTDVAATRLRLLHESFGPGSVAFLSDVATPDAGARVAVDLGCGPGRTTRMLGARARDDEPCGPLDATMARVVGVKHG